MQDVDITHVLVPLDGSELALQAIPTARALAERFGASLHTVTLAESKSQAIRARRLAAAALDVPDEDERVFIATEGEPDEVIAQRAESLGSCLICLATHGRGRLGGALVGSVARSVLQRVQGPVIVLGPQADNPGWTPRPRRWPAPLSVQRIVACVDGTKASEQVMPIAAAWAQRLAMELTIVTIVHDDPPPLALERTDRLYDGDDDATGYIDRLVETWRASDVHVNGEVLRDPISPASAIRDYLTQRPAGLLALSTHARSGMQRVRLGAVAASIVHTSVVPCLVNPVR